MDLLNDLTSSTGDNPLIVFDCDSVNPLVQLTALCERKETGDSKPKSRNGDKLELKHFHDQTLAQDYVCKICQFIVVDPREHNVIGSTFTCASLFCYNCICNWIKSGKSYCPSPGCLTIGFEESAFREIGARDVSRLSGLMMNCPFSCGLKLTYSDYTFLSHRNQCPSNPENMCKICKSPKLDSGGVHDCRIVFNEMRQKIESLNIKVSKLTLVIDQLRSESNAKKETTSTTEQPVKKKEIFRQDIKGEITKQNSSSNEQLINVIRSEAENLSQKEMDKVFTTFYSNSFWSNGKYGSSAGINLAFHYGERSINFYDIQSTCTIQSLRSQIADKFKGHDPGQMLFMQHRSLYKSNRVGYCGFQMGNNVITILPIDTPNYGEPDCLRMTLHLPSKSKSMVNSKQSRLLNFYSNNLDSQQEANRIKLTLVSDNSSFMMDSVEDKLTMGDIWYRSTRSFGNNPINMVYLTHLVLEDKMTVNHYGFRKGTTDITLVPVNCHLNYGANGALHLKRFETNTNLANKSSREYRPYHSYYNFFENKFKE